jgi:Uma2 family endonuclease
MLNVVGRGYTADDLDWLRNEMRIAAHLELDPWGSLIVSPVSDEHQRAMVLLNEQARDQLDLPPASVWPNGFQWTVPGGTGYLMIPDVAVLAPGWQRVGELHVDRPPLLIVEVASPSTRRVDRTRKLADYRLGGAEKYLLVDLPNTFELHDFGAGTVVTAQGAIDVVVGGQPVRFSLPAPEDL